MNYENLPVKPAPCVRCSGCPDVEAKNRHATHKCGGLRGVDVCAASCREAGPCLCGPASGGLEDLKAVVAELRTAGVPAMTIKAEVEKLLRRSPLDF